MVALLLVVALGSPFAPDTNGSDHPCWLEPLRVSLPEIAAMGRIAEEVARDHCLRRTRASLPLMRHSFVVAETRLGSFSLFGERLSYGVDVVVQPNLAGGPDSIYAVPALDLPPAWALAIDRATYPVLIIGGAAVITTVLVELLR